MVSKSGLMVGLGETEDELLEVFRNMREHDIDVPYRGPVPAADEEPRGSRPLLPS